MAERVLLVICLSIVLRVSSCWKDPNVPVLPTLTITPQPPDVVTGRAGEEVQYTCITGDKPDRPIILEAYQRKENMDIFLSPTYRQSGSKLTFKKTLRESDSGTDIFCQIQAHDRDAADFIFNSKSFKLMVTPAATPDTATEIDPHLLPIILPTMSVTPTPRDGVAELSVGDQIQVTCRYRDERFRFLNIYQVKGNFETVLNYTRDRDETVVTFVTNVTQADDKTMLYCWYDLSPDIRIRSDYISLRVGKENQESNVTTAIKPLLIIIPLLSIFAIFYS